MTGELCHTLQFISLQRLIYKLFYIDNLPIDYEPLYKLYHITVPNDLTLHSVRKFFCKSDKAFGKYDG